MEGKENVFKRLSAIDCTKYVEQKNGLNYLSWAWAWGMTKSLYPTANYEVGYSEGKPFVYDPILGYMVATSVTIDGETIPMHLPVMDSSNKAMRDVPYTYKTRFGEKSVVAATMFDVNTAIMRCLTKNLALFGLGHYIYAGEDIPMDLNDDEPKAEPKAEPKVKAKAKKAEPKDKAPIAGILEKAVNAARLLAEKCETEESLRQVWLEHKDLHTSTEFKQIVNNAKARIIAVN